MAAKKKDAEEQPAEPKKGGKLKLIIILLVVLALLGGGGFAAWKFFLQPKPEESADGNATDDKAAKAKEAVPPEVVNLEPFVVNLADPMGRRYLKVTMDVEVEPGVSAELNAALPKAKDSLLLLLSSKTFSEISTMDQKIELKNEIMERLNQIVGKGKVKNIYFTEFVIQ
jgi:flagellar FliL protein